MKTKRLFRVLIVLLLPIAVSGLWAWQTVRHARHQRQLDRELIQAILNYDTARAIALLRAGADANAHEQPDPTPSLWQQLRDKLLRRKPPVNKSDVALVLVMDSLVDRPKTALKRSGVPRENARLVAALLKHGAKIEAVNAIEQTALVEAAQLGYTETARILLEHGADPNHICPGDMSALIFAALRGNSALIRVLLEKGANPNAQDVLGDTALMSVTRFAFDRAKEARMVRFRSEFAPAKSLVALLLKYHADPNLKNQAGQTALSFARQSKRPDLVKMLIRAGAKE